jgi:hypothetical protein
MRTLIGKRSYLLNLQSLCGWKRSNLNVIDLSIVSVLLNFKRTILLKFRIRMHSSNKSGLSARLVLNPARHHAIIASDLILDILR